MRTMLTALLLLVASASANAGIVYELPPSSADLPIGGLEFGTTPGSNFIFTNTIIGGPGGLNNPPLFLNFGVGYNFTDGDGNVFYSPKNDVFQLYVLTGMLAEPPGTNPVPVVAGLFTGHAEAINLGNGRYNFIANLDTISAFPGPYDSTGFLSFTFDTHLPLGRQIEGGTLTLTVNGGVPEPASVILVGTGCGLAILLGRRRK